jgi:hypothetical protein
MRDTLLMHNVLLWNRGGSERHIRGRGSWLLCRYICAIELDSETGLPFLALAQPNTYSEHFLEGEFYGGLAYCVGLLTSADGVIIKGELFGFRDGCVGNCMIYLD